MPDQIRIRSGSTRKRWPEAGRMILAHWLASGLDPFGQSLTGVSQNQIRSALVSMYDPDHLWKNGTESESKKTTTGSGLVALCQKPGQMIPAHWLASGRDVWPNPDQVIQIGSGSVLRNMIHAFLGKTELKWMQQVGSGMYYPAQFWLHAGRNGHNWP